MQNWIRTIMTNLISEIIHASLKDLFQEQPDVLTSTRATTMTEWNLAHHFAHSLSKYLFWFDHDNDVVKRNHESKRPDIIFHKRDSDSNNFLVIEMKKSDTICNTDVDKIKNDWFSPPLSYQYGACISVDSINQYKIRVFKNNSLGCYANITNENQVRFCYPTPSQNTIDTVNSSFRGIMREGITLEKGYMISILEGFRI